MDEFPGTVYSSDREILGALVLGFGSQYDLNESHCLKNWRTDWVRSLHQTHMETMTENSLFCFRIYLKSLNKNQSSFLFIKL